MTRNAIFEGAWCRVVKVENNNHVEFLIEQQDGRDSLGTIRWGQVTPKYLNEVLAELGQAIDDEQQKVNKAIKIPFKKK